VGIYKKDADQVSLKNLPPCEEPGPGNPLNKDRVVDFSYTSDALAEMIVEAWKDEAYRTKLLNKENALPIRLTQTPTTYGVRPVAGIKCCPRSRLTSPLAYGLGASPMNDARWGDK
jgi:hypothetical protein